MKREIRIQWITDMELAKAVRNFRLEAGFSQKMVAAALCCERSTYSTKEEGKTRFSLNELQQLAALFQFSPEIFFHPELYPLPLHDIRVKRKNSPVVGNLQELQMPERELIALLRQYHALYNDSNLIEQFQRKLLAEIEKFHNEHQT